MVIVYLFASFVGALTTFAWLSSDSWLLALLCTPLGGSALSLIVALTVALPRTPREPRGAQPSFHRRPSSTITSGAPGASASGSAQPRLTPDHV